MDSQANNKIQMLKKRQAQIKGQIQKLESREKARERKRDTRRKILIGSYFLEQARSSGDLNELYKKMTDYLSRESDLALFESQPDTSDVTSEASELVSA